MPDGVIDVRQPTPFPDRGFAGRLLAAEVAKLALADPVVLALPRGGVPVAVEVARAIGAPLDLVLVRKVGMPGEPEFAAAAVVDGAAAETVINEDAISAEDLDSSYFATSAAAARREIERRRRLYLGDRRPVPLDGRDLVVVDDGIATGTTVRAALKALRRKKPHKLILAVPVVAASVSRQIAEEVDLLIALAIPRRFGSVGAFFDDFTQLDDDEVIRLLASVS